MTECLMNVRWTATLLCFALLVGACQSGPSDSQPTLFEQLPADSTGISFSNDLKEGPGLNVIDYDYFYNGGGVAAGDFTGNGRPDLYFTANMGPNYLYLNRGNFRFEEVAQAAGVQARGGWTTGVTTADVNGDGRLDLYVCRSGRLDEKQRRNELYVHQGVNNAGIPVFEEQAAKYGLDSPAYSTHATFFDYDRDGDLDVYLLNHPTESYRRFRMGRIKQQRDSLAGDRLFRNDDGSFVDVTEEAGIRSSPISYGLSATVSDINGNGWPDIYVANDYLEDDFLYVNQGDGTFEESLRSYLDHTSYSSMGADIADYNNDGRPDIFVADMLAEGNRRKKLLKGPKDLQIYRFMQHKGFYYQYQRNMLHLNNGDGSFSEIGQLAGVSNTDWSWASLFADFDLDGYKDLYVTNGFRRDYTNLDYLNDTLIPTQEKQDEPDNYALAQQMPSTPIPNYAFRNTGDLTFKDRSAEWGLDQKGFSNGAAYADLDGDGDLDLAVNNIDEEAFVYRNNAREQTANNFLAVELEGGPGNRLGLGATVTVTTQAGRSFHQEMVPARGFQSAVPSTLSFGVGRADTLDVTVTWPDQTRQHRAQVSANQTLTLHQGEAQSFERESDSESRSLMEKSVPDENGLAFTHRENPYVDFEQEPLLPHMLSRLGPALAVGDVSGNGRDDVFVGGARGQSAALFVQQSDGTFEQASARVFSGHRGYEDVDAAFVDVNGDGALDLYVVSGGKAARGSAGYQDRLYLNDGAGQFAPAPGVLPSIESSGGVVAVHDFDEDGRPDLFVGGRVQPGAYPLSPRSYLLRNTGGEFKDVTAEVAPELAEPGMVTDALWHDLDGSGRAELVVAGEWMPIRVFRVGEDETFEEVSEQMGFTDTEGWWYSLEVADLSGDGRVELVAGNRGLNAQVQACPEAPAAIYAADFAQDGTVDPIITHHMEGKEYPVYWHDTLVEAIPPFENRFDSYEAYATSTIDDILTASEKETATQRIAVTFETSLFYREDGTFQRQALPLDVQFAPIHDLVVRDVNGDERPDLLLAGNDFTVLPQWGRADAEKGTVLINRENRRFEPLRSRKSGFFAPWDVRALGVVQTAPSLLLLVGANNDSLSTFELRSFYEGQQPR